jgi:hypothetical protein
MTGHTTARSLGRLGLAAAAALAAVSLTACGPAFDNTVFDKAFHDSCVGSASANNPAATAEAYCTCVMTQLDKVPVEQRKALTPTSQPVTDAETMCSAQVQGSAPAATNDTGAAPAATPPPSNSGM